MRLTINLVLSNIWKDKLVKDLYSCNIKDYCMTNLGDDWEDLFHDSILAMLCIDEAKLEDIYNRNKHIDYFFLVVRNNIYRTYKAKKVEFTTLEHWYDVEDPEYVETGNEILDAIDEWADERNSMWWYHSRLIKLYAEEGSYRAVSEKTMIPKASIADSIREFKRWINEICVELGIEI